MCPACAPGSLFSPAFSLPFGSMVTFSFKVQLKGAASRKSSRRPAETSKMSCAPSPEGNGRERAPQTWPCVG